MIKRIETFLLIAVAVCCGNVSNLIGRTTINIPEIIFGVHASSVLTVKPGSKVEHIFHCYSYLSDIMEEHK